jgi:hypothetical protein
MAQTQCNDTATMNLDGIKRSKKNDPADRKKSVAFREISQNPNAVVWKS